MAIKRSLGVQKRRRKTPSKGRLRSVLSTPNKSAESAEPSGAFDPRPYLSKLATGKTSREYNTAGPIFSQGDSADAVFYVDGGKVKLTVVSTSGKEAEDYCNYYNCIQDRLDGCLHWDIAIYQPEENAHHH